MITSKVIKILPKNIRVKVENNSEFKNIIGNINWLTFENILRNGLNFFIFAWIARYLGPEEFGFMTYAIAFISLFIAFSTLGLDDIVVKAFISHPEKRSKYLGSTLFLKFLGSLLMLMISILSILIIEGGNLSIAFMISILAVGYIFKSSDVMDLWFKSQIKSQYSVFARSISFLIISLLKVILILTQAPLIAFILMYSLDFALASIFLFVFYKKFGEIPIKNFKVDFKIMKTLIVTSLPLFLGGVVATIQANLDQVMLKNLVNPSELGYYGATLKIVSSFAFLSIILRNSLFPSITAAKNFSNEKYMKRMQALYQLMMLTFISIALPIFLLKDPLVNILYGRDYSYVAILLPGMLLRLLFTHYGTARGVYLIHENLLKYSFWTTLIGTILDIILNLVLIPKYQSLGAIIAFCASYFVTIFLIDLIYPKTRRNALVMIKSMFTFFNLLKL